jgi:hypothetical protein
MRALVLFKGTGSIDRALESAGFEVLSLDIDPKCNATWTCDILDWECPLEPGSVDYVWASPLCTEYSRALTTRARNLPHADRLVLKTLEIIERLQPKYWTLENPGTGLLKTREFMQGLPYQDVCALSIYDTGSRTGSIWGNVPFVPRPMCTRKDPCEQVSEGRHPTSAQRAPGKAGGVRRASASDSYSLDQLYSLPPALCEDIVSGL